MRGKVLIIDPIATNRIALRVKLAANHYDVMQTENLAEAMQCVQATTPDLILCAHRLPDADPLRVIARLRKVGLMGKVPLLITGAPDAPKERLALLAAGADGVMEKPIDDGLLLARARSVIRAYASASEWQLRDGTSRALGLAEPAAGFGPRPHVRFVACARSTMSDWTDAVATRVPADLSHCTPADAVAFDASGRSADAFVLMVAPGYGPEVLSLLPAIRSQADTRHSVILVVQTEPDAALGAQMLDMGANDLMSAQRSPQELALRLETLLGRKRLTDALRSTVKNSVEAAVTDPLTGLHNRRYAMPHLARIAERACETARPFAVMVADMDHFKRINDTFGHAAGDTVLIETARRLRENVRAIDLVARIGGEEFLIVLPGAGLRNARNAAQRLCNVIRDTPFDVRGQTQGIPATVSIGMTVCDPVLGVPKTMPVTPEALLDRADKALYGAKAEGRDRVTYRRPAA